MQFDHPALPRSYRGLLGGVVDHDYNDGSAADIDDTSCGWTAGNNNVAGEGRVDALDAVAAAVADGT